MVLDYIVEQVKDLYKGIANHATMVRGGQKATCMETLRLRLGYFPTYGVNNYKK